MRHIFFSALIALFFGACSTPQTPEKHTFHGYVRFLADQAQLRAEARLLGPDSMPAAPPGGMRYQGIDMTLLAADGAYRYQRNGAPGARAVFSWADEAGRNHEFAVPLLPLDSFGFGAKTILRHQPYTLRWSGAPLEKGETLVLMWENRVTGQTVPMEIYGTASLPSIEFPAAKLAEIPAGRWSLYLVRKKMVKGDAGGVPATGVAEYYTRPDTLTVQ